MSCPALAATLAQQHAALYAARIIAPRQDASRDYLAWCQRRAAYWAGEARRLRGIE